MQIAPNVGSRIALRSRPHDLTTVGSYEVLFVPNPRRALIRYDGGTVVLVTRAPDGFWDLAAVPATPEEQAVIEREMPARDTTETTLVKDLPDPGDTTT
jgi:hypothetical protein